MEREVKPNDDYLDKLYKFLPAEITGAYLGIRTLIAPDVDTNDKFLLFFGVAILCLSPLFYAFVTKIKNGLQIAFLTFSYVVWAANIDIQKIAAARVGYFQRSPFAQFVLDPIFIKSILVLWVIMLVPMVLKRDETTQ